MALLAALEPLAIDLGNRADEEFLNGVRGDVCATARDNWRDASIVTVREADDLRNRCQFLQFLRAYTAQMCSLPGAQPLDDSLPGASRAYDGDATKDAIAEHMAHRRRAPPLPADKVGPHVCILAAYLTWRTAVVREANRMSGAWNRVQEREAAERLASVHRVMEALGFAPHEAEDAWETHMQCVIRILLHPAARAE